MTGRVTMLGISRWSKPGGSYRTAQRFFTTTLNWGKVRSPKIASQVSCRRV
ncbi:MAG: hypothetical protein ABFS45_16770 [Pseudomonadota bacterium]